MSTKIKVIVDNIPACGLDGEWGLCIYTEFGGKKILVDTGASGLFAKNAKALGVDIGAIDFAVLSHAHYDHANGMPVFFAENERAKFYVRAGAGEDCYHANDGSSYIGIEAGLLEKYADRIQFVSGDYEVMTGAWLIAHKVDGLDAIGKRENMYRKTSDGWQFDDFAHEQSLVLETEKGLVIISSCSHGGAGNIIREVAETFPGKRVYGLVGGLHLYNKTEEEVRDLAQQIRETGIEFICTGHCTEEKAYQILKEELGDKVSQMRVGLEITLRKRKILLIHCS